MPIRNRLAELLPEITGWRHDFHRHPELMYEVHRTAGMVADRLRDFGCDEAVEGIGRTGVVGVIRGAKRRRAGWWACAPTWTRCRSPNRPGRPMPRPCRG